MSGIVYTDLLFYAAQVNSDSTNNGGEISENVISSNVSENIFPNVNQAERLAGLTRYRKIFSTNRSALVNDDNDGIVLANHLLCIGKQGQGEDYYRVAEGTDDDNQGNMSVADWYGCGKLYESASVDATSIKLQFEGPDGGPYDGVKKGNMLRLAKYEYNSTLGYYVLVTEEFIRADATANISWADSVATITLASGLKHDWAAYEEDVTYTYGAACVELGDTGATKELISNSSSAGVLDIDEVIAYNDGSIEDTFTITFTSSTEFTVSGNKAGSLSTGSTASDYLPPNGDSYYFKINVGAWSGSFVMGDIIVIDTHHAAKGIWIKEVVPADAASVSNNMPHINVAGESE